MISSLVKIDVAAFRLKKSPRQVFDLVEGGSVSEVGLLWVWNLATNPAGQRRELRFWCPELMARASGDASRYHSRNINWIISQILPGNRQSFNPGDVDGLFQIRHNTRMSFSSELPPRRIGNRNVYSRKALETFLSHRWIGANNGGLAHG